MAPWHSNNLTMSMGAAQSSSQEGLDSMGSTSLGGSMGPRASKVEVLRLLLTWGARLDVARQVRGRGLLVKYSWLDGAVDSCAHSYRHAPRMCSVLRRYGICTLEIHLCFTRI